MRTPRMRQCNCGGGREFCGGLLPLSAITPPVISSLPTKQPFMLHPKERNHSTAVSISSFLSTQNPQNQRLWWFNPASNASQIFELSPYVGWASITSTTTDFCSHGGLEPFSVWLKANLSLLFLFSLLCWFYFSLICSFLVQFPRYGIMCQNSVFISEALYQLDILLIF